MSTSLLWFSFIVAAMQSLQASLTAAHQSSIPNPNLNPTTSDTAAANVKAVIDSTVHLVEPYADSSKTTNGETLPQSLHVVTPLVYSEALSGEHDVYLKMDCLQPSGSFKIRGTSSSYPTIRLKRVVLIPQCRSRRSLPRSIRAIRPRNVHRHILGRQRRSRSSDRREIPRLSMPRCCSAEDGARCCGDVEGSRSRG